MSTPVIRGARSPRGDRGLARRLRLLGPDLLVTALSLLAVAGATWWLLGLPATYLLHVATLYLGLIALVAMGLPKTMGAAGIGAANRITLLRATWVLAVAGLVLHEAGSGRASWWIIVWSAAAMVLDGVDGHVARRSGETSRFGARLDMEVDALLLLVLAVLVWQGGKVGAWIIAVGGLRYLFVAAGWIWPSLRGELLESQRRKTVCVIQGTVLLVCLLPMIRPSPASLLAGGALALLLYSFVVDVASLAASGRTSANSRPGAAGDSDRGDTG